MLEFLPPVSRDIRTARSKLPLSIDWVRIRDTSRGDNDVEEYENVNHEKFTQICNQESLPDEKKRFLASELQKTFVEWASRSLPDISADRTIARKVGDLTNAKPICPNLHGVHKKDCTTETFPRSRTG